MSLKKLPELQAATRGQIQSFVSPSALARWAPGIHAAAGDSADNTISILDVIGEDWWTGEGVTSKRIAGALRAIGERDVIVNINSPGGDMFEGVAIYNMLREHAGRVTVNILGLAASAASIIAMAGDEIRIGRPSFLMIHNCWCLAAGNRHDFAELSEQMEPFDAAMADVYQARTSIDLQRIQTLMDKESWIGGSAAVADGWADALLGDDAIASDGDGAKAAAIRRIEAALRASGMPRSEAQRLLSDFKSGLSDSAGNLGGLSDSAAQTEAVSALQSLIQAMKV
ncbi:Clp protease ClpP [Corticibacter populi]|uniref:ATP-dependent Clp protease proteolytic subunit n=1 Tax=Corticibacter populi TaxID=1550736 RepID=A0A3M6QUM5_9BURK|nr:head maturation protease, ClpP-related [Corticibacter populi]RMX06720.1 Clp protease ClpP [Corticibacter populi]RZS31699.1 ATP-dependent protease ClpP protease subunit [Corticibacter populi]